MYVEHAVNNSNMAEPRSLQAMRQQRAAAKMSFCEVIQLGSRAPYKPKDERTIRQIMLKVTQWHILKNGVLVDDHVEKFSADRAARVLSINPKKLQMFNDTLQRCLKKKFDFERYMEYPFCVLRVATQENIFSIQKNKK